MVKKVGNDNNNTLNGTSADDLLYGKGGNDVLNGLAGDDKLSGGDGNDKLYGGTGNDELWGGNGNDKMFGGEGADEFHGGSGVDTVNYSDSTTKVRAYLDTNQSAYGATGDTFDKVENVIGSAFGDELQSGLGGDAYGGAGDDSLYGGGGLGSSEDGGRLRGGAGHDTLTMTYGDTHAWVENGSGYDTIKGFIEGSDMLFIKLSDFGLGDTFDTNEIHSETSATSVGTNAQFIFETDTKYLWFDSNGTDAGGLSLVANFENATLIGGDLGKNDFDFIL